MYKEVSLVRISANHQKEMAEEMFHAGATNMLYGYMKLMNEQFDKHYKKKEK